MAGDTENSIDEDMYKPVEYMAASHSSRPRKKSSNPSPEHQPGSPMDDQSRPRVQGIHHLKFAVSNLDISIAWYERVLGARRVADLDHIGPDSTRFAAVCHMPDWNGLYLELRLMSNHALKDRGWDPVTLMVNTRQDLLRWVQWLDRWGTTHSPLLTGVRGWLVVFEDPDARRIRIYSKEGHGGMEAMSVDGHWLNEA